MSDFDEAAPGIAHPTGLYCSGFPYLTQDSQRESVSVSRPFLEATEALLVPLHCWDHTASLPVNTRGNDLPVRAETKLREKCLDAVVGRRACHSVKMLKAPFM
jgi:hypothetical protein